MKKKERSVGSGERGELRRAGERMNERIVLECIHCTRTGSTGCVQNDNEPVGKTSRSGYCFPFVIRKTNAPFPGAGHVEIVKDYAISGCYIDSEGGWAIVVAN